MTVFFIALSITLIAIGLGTAHGIISDWRFRSDRNYERFAQAYAEAAAMHCEARQAGERA